MKRIFFIPVFIFCVVLVTFGSGNDLTLTYRQLKSSRVLDFKVNSQSIVYQMSLKQTNDGYFEMEAPPFFCANLDNTLIIGELKDQGIFSAMLDPFSSEASSLSWKRNGNLKTVRSPSLKPKLSGLAVCFDKIDIIALSPMMNKRAPLGAGFIIGDSNAFAGMLYASQNNVFLSGSDTGFLVNWNNLGIGKDMVFTILGANAQAEIAGAEIRAWAYIQSAWDLLLGGGTTCAWQLDLATDEVRMSASRLLGGTGISLKYEDGTEKPQENLTLEGRFASDDSGISLKYECETFEVPVFGGQSQKRSIKWEVGAKAFDLDLKCTNTTSFDKDKGVISGSTYLIGTERDNLKAEVSFTLNRPTSGGYYASGGKLTLKAPKATLEMAAERTELEMNWEKDIEDIKMKVSVNQDRYLSVSITIAEL